MAPILLIFLRFIDQNISQIRIGGSFGHRSYANAAAAAADDDDDDNDDDDDEDVADDAVMCGHTCIQRPSFQ